MMKQLLNGVMLLLLFAVAITSCTKDEKKVYFEGGTAPVLSASIADSLTLLSADADKEVLKLTWTNPSYTFTTGASSQNVSYVLELDTAGGNFASGVKKSYSIVNDVNKTFTAADLNAVLVGTMKLAVDEPHTIAMRVSSSIGKTSASSLVSNVVNLIVTPYAQPITLSYLYVPGNYQGWSPPTAPQLGSDDNKLYEGYVYFSESKTEFKFTSIPEWSGTNYGSGGAGNLSSDGGAGNLKLPGDAGVYQTNVNLDKLTWTATPTTWAIIGAATPKGWDNETALTYNVTDGTFEIASIALTADAFKFRANNAWDINLGSDANGSVFLAYNGSNLTVAAAGNYKVILDLSHPKQYTYKLIKL